MKKDIQEDITDEMRKHPILSTVEKPLLITTPILATCLRRAIIEGTGQSFMCTKYLKRILPYGHPAFFVIKITTDIDCDIPDEAMSMLLLVNIEPGYVSLVTSEDNVLEEVLITKTVTDAREVFYYNNVDMYEDTEKFLTKSFPTSVCFVLIKIWAELLQ